MGCGLLTPQLVATDSLDVGLVLGGRRETIRLDMVEPHTALVEHDTRKLSAGNVLPTMVTFPEHAVFVHGYLCATVPCGGFREW